MKKLFLGVTKAHSKDLNSDLSTVQQHLYKQTLCYRIWVFTNCCFHSLLFFLQLLKPLLHLQVAFGCSFLDPPLLGCLSPAYRGMTCSGFLCDVCCVSKLFRKEKKKRKRHTAHSTLFDCFSSLGLNAKLDVTHNVPECALICSHLDKLRKRQ